MSNASGTLPRMEDMALASTLLLAGAIASYMLVREPWLMAGASLGVLLLALVVTRPLGVIAIMLALGPMDLSFLTGGFKSLFRDMGGLDANGIRLLAVCAGFGLVLLVSPKVRAAATSKAGRWYLLFLIYISFTLPMSAVPNDGARLYLKLWYPFLIFIGTVGLADTRVKLEKLMDVVLWSAAAIALIATPITILQGRYYHDPSGFIRIAGVIGYSPFSFYLLIAMLMALSRYIVRRQSMYLVLAMVLGFWLVLTFTRITLLATMVSVLAVSLLEISRRGWRAVAGGAMVAAVVGIPLIPAVLKRSLGFVPGPVELLQLMANPAALYNSINWQGREILWPIVYSKFLASPVIGLGLGMSSAITRENFPAEAGTVVHNEYLRLATDTGVIGVALFAVAMFVWLFAANRARRTSDPLAREFALPAIGGILAWSIISITDNPFDYYAAFTQFVGFAVAGAVASAALARKG